MDQRSILIGPPAVCPDLAIGAGERAKIGHLDHSASEVVEEGSRVSTVSSDLSVGGAVVEELLIRVEQPPQVDQVSEVVVVEAIGGKVVKRRKGVVATGPGAVSPDARHEGGVDVGFVVDSVTEGCAPRLSYCMRSCKIYNYHAILD